MDIILNGYFDKNFGDDLMQRLAAKALSEHNIYVYCKEREMLTHLEDLPNVYINKEKITAEAYIDVIGTGFMYKGKRAKAERLIAGLGKGQKRYPKTALINCSLENFDTKIERHFAKKDLGRYDFITCRDGETYQFLKSEFKNKEIIKADDMVFADTAPAPTDGDVLGIIPVRRLYSGENYEYYKELARFCDMYTESKKVLIFAFDNGLENDVSAAVSVRNMMKRKDRAEIVIYNGDTAEFAKKISECGFIVTSRFHGLVLAIRSNIKAAAVSDRKKLDILCSENGVPNVAKSEFCAEKLLELAKACDTSKYKDFGSANLHLSKLKEFLER